MAYSHLLVYIYFVFLSIISNFVPLFSTFNTSALKGVWSEKEKIQEKKIIVQKTRNN